jgi:hypothetical protein
VLELVQVLQKLVLLERLQRVVLLQRGLALALERVQLEPLRL